MLHALLAAVVACIATPQAAPDARVERWRADLQFLARELPARHKDLFFQQPREEFEAAVAELDAALPALDDDAIVAELMRLVASVGDGHTALQIWNGPLAATRLPLRLARFGDELRVVGVGGDHAAALGGAVVSIGGVAAAEAWTRVTAIVAHENPAALAAFAPRHLELGALLHGLGLAPDARHATFRLRSDDGTERDLEVAPLGPAQSALGLVALPAADRVPRWQSHPDASYWFEIDAAAKLLFLQYNRCQDDPAHPFAAFCEELFAAADAQSVDTVVVDLRRNGGGNSLVIAPLYRGLGARKRLRENGHLFVAIGPPTFSSAMMNALELKAGFGAILVGEPTGGKPNAYGEVKQLELPNSRLAVSYSTKFFRQVPDDPPSVVPDVAAPLTWAHWRDGRDPVLEAIAAARK